MPEFIVNGVRVDHNGEPVQASEKPARDSHTTSDKTPEDERTVAQLKEALDAGGHEYDHNARRADLVALAAQHGV